MSEKFKAVLPFPKGDGFQSIIMRNNGKLGRIYRVDTWTHALRSIVKLGFGLTYFESLEDAIRFLQREGSHYLNVGQIFQCEVGETWKPKVPLIFSKSVGQLIAEYKEIQKSVAVFGSGYSSYLYDWPQGTMMTDKIKLIKWISIGDQDETLKI